MPTTSSATARATLLPTTCSIGLSSWVAAGAFSPEKHTSLQHCAECELSEEAALRGGTWHPLLPPGHRGVHEVKWCSNRFQPFLVIAPEADPNPGPLDAEELIEVPMHLSV